ncbi:serine/threonine protein kinase [Pyxidicoccus parkwayensis]|uniref:Serine/threonine protein kinase n=1 Tax=Pyxidicoccus parkwayensis TaxID=2813578 RepID=A0ABX7NWI0_9BACT|nr:serine/threonine-protein kinase [Pyxidicoccus parkwaysis]QSQ22719.1 serine/threonine protein kinase [Pyxidicoccus parkwaysis]
MVDRDDTGAESESGPELSTKVTSDDGASPPRSVAPASRPNTGRDAAPVPAKSARSLGGRVGRFIPLKVLGQGGMGVVYAAYDPDLDRKVALKLLRVTSADTDLEAGRTRLLREAQAMARVSHPNVIPVFDVGEWEEQVFVTMELVEGGTLRDWQQAKPRSWRETLETYLSAGRGLEAAHAVGLVHRDFKPTNVLVGRDGRVFVTDFGLARPVGNSGREDGPPELPSPVSEGSGKLFEPLTQAGVVLGTPPFMSPEQFRGDAVDARSDQFSFCAALYRALYGTRPFDPDVLSRAAKSKARRLASGAKGEAASPALPPDLIQEPPRDAKVPAWVRRAVMRGLSLEAEGRFASMGDLLEALSQEKHFARRRRLGGGAVAAVALVAAVGGGAWWQSRVCAGAEGLLADAWNPEARQRMTTAFGATGSPVAADMAARVSGVLDAYASAWAKQHTEACEATRVRAQQTEALLSQRVVCLERRHKDLRALVGALASVEKSGVEKALDAAYALPSPQDCADVEALSEQQPRPADPMKRAELEALEGRLSEVKALLDTSRQPQALEKARVLEPLVVATGYLPLMAELRFHLGWLQALQGQKEQGAGVLEQAVFDAEAGRADRLEVAVLNKLLFVEGERGRFDFATRWARLGKATLQRLGGDAVLESDLLVNGANLSLMQEKPEEARTQLQEANALLAKTLEPGHPKRARVAFTLGRTLLESGAYAEAAKVLEEALHQTEAAVGPRHLDVARRHQALSMALREQGDFTGALEHARASVAIHRELLGNDHLKVAEALDEEGMGLLGLKRYEEALKVYEEALKVKRQHLEPGDEELHYSYDGVGQALLGLGRTRDAVEPLRQAVTFASAQEDSLGESGFALAQALYKEGQSDEARTEATRAGDHFKASGREVRAQAVQTWLESLPPEGKAKPSKVAKKPAHAERKRRK